MQSTAQQALATWSLEKRAFTPKDLLALFRNMSIKGYTKLPQIAQEGLQDIQQAYGKDIMYGVPGRMGDLYLPQHLKKFKAGIFKKSDVMEYWKNARSS